MQMPACWLERCRGKDQPEQSLDGLHLVVIELQPAGDLNGGQQKRGRHLLPGCFQRRLAITQQAEEALAHRTQNFIPQGLRLGERERDSDNQNFITQGLRLREREKETVTNIHRQTVRQ